MKLTLVIGSLLLAACSSEKPAPQAAVPEVSEPATTTSRHPLAKYLELAGFRMREASPGRLEVKFAVINHSEADLGDLTVKVRLRTNQAKAEDPPVAEFQADVPRLGPKETKDVIGKTDTKLRIYELPDWQFLRAEFDITAPAP